jgi:alkylation response protein AidB-like acyl-CoA dehydrogenase
MTPGPSDDAPPLPTRGAFNEVFLDDVPVADEHVLGAPGDGWRVMRATLAHERANVGGEGFGGVGLLSADRYVELVRRLGRGDDPVVRQELARLVCHLRVAKLNAQRRCGSPKLALSRNYERIGALVCLVLGPALIADSATWGTYAWARFVLGVPGMRIGGGTDEILLNAIAERDLGLPRDR